MPLNCSSNIQLKYFKIEYKKLISSYFCFFSYKIVLKICEQKLNSQKSHYLRFVILRKYQNSWKNNQFKFGIDLILSNVDIFRVKENKHISLVITKNLIFAVLLIVFELCPKNYSSQVTTIKANFCCNADSFRVMVKKPFSTSDHKKSFFLLQC